MKWYIHSEPHLFHYKHYVLEAENEEQARERFNTFLDSTVSEFYPSQSVVDTEKGNTNIFDHPFVGDTYEEINI